MGVITPSRYLLITQIILIVFPGLPQIITPINTHYYYLNLGSVTQALYSLLSPHLAPMLAINTRKAASLASLLISAQELLYAVKVESINALLTTPPLNAPSKLCMA